MSSHSNKPRNNSRNVSEDGTESRILKSLSAEHVQSSKSLQKNVDCAQSTLYKYLKPLEKNHKVISNKIGREVFYALPENSAELYDSTRTRTLLEDHVVRNAHRLMDEILRVDPLDESEMNRISYNCLLLERAVDNLRKTYLDLPIGWIEKKTIRISDEVAFQERIGVKKPRVKPRHLALEMSDWYQHLLEVLIVLEG